MYFKLHMSYFLSICPHFSKYLTNPFALGLKLYLVVVHMKNTSSMFAYSLPKSIAGRGGRVPKISFSF